MENFVTSFWWCVFGNAIFITS